MNGAWYFKHDYSARNDQKLVELEMEMGVNVGYALWFKLLEVMGEAGGTMPKAKEKLFAHAMRIDLQMLNSLIGICVRIGLLFDDGDEYVNTRFREAHNKIAENSAKNSKNAATRWSKETKTGGKSPNLEPKNQENDPKSVKTDLKEPNLGESSVSDEPKKEPKTDAIVDHWNTEAKTMRCMKVTPDISKAVAKIMKTYDIAEITQTITNYHSVLRDESCFFSYKWNLGEFLSRANGFPVFYGDRDEIMAKYRKSGGKNANSEQPKTRKELLETYK